MEGGGRREENLSFFKIRIVRSVPEPLKGKNALSDFDLKKKFKNISQFFFF